MLLLIDNYDSFTYNLVQYFGELGEVATVIRNDEKNIEELVEMQPKRICISPGPCTPNEAGISNEVIKKFAANVPILGVCLGHQCIGQVFGATICRADRVMHGKTSPIYHDGDGIFETLPMPFTATRYHSLIIKPDTLPDELQLTATSDQENEIMGVRHKEYPLHGVQFHPESILTESGKALLHNFLNL